MRAGVELPGRDVDGIALLLKFCTKPVYAEAFRQQGALLMRPLGFFAELRDGEPGTRGDPGEPARHDTYCFSLHALTTQRIAEVADGAPLVDERNLRLGPHVAMVRDPAAFLSRVDKAIRAANVRSARCGLVSYTNDGARECYEDPFAKSEAFAHQCEFRIVLERDADGPEFRLFVGSLADICEVVPAATLNHYVHCRSC